MLQIFGLKLRYSDVLIIAVNVIAVVAYLIVRARNKRIRAEQQSAVKRQAQEELISPDQNGETDTRN